MAIPTKEEFLAAIQAGDLNTIKQFIQAGANVNEPGESGRTPLHYASRTGDVSICKILIEAGAIPTTRDTSFTPCGRTPLWDAAESGSAEVVKFLVNCGLDPNDSDGAGTSPLCVVSTTQACEALINAGVDVNHVDYQGWRPLAYACDKPKEVFRTLLACGADPFWEIGQRSDLFTSLDDLVRGKDPALLAMLQEARSSGRNSTLLTMLQKARSMRRIVGAWLKKGRSFYMGSKRRPRIAEVKRTITKWG